MKLVSVIVPIYNQELYIKSCVQSIRNQTYSNLEIILVNDGSTDESGSICEFYAKEDERIKVIHQENGGLSAARNAGLDIATGEYICFIDCDDWIEACCIEKNMEHAEGADIVLSGYSEDIVDTNNSVTNSNRVIFHKDFSSPLSIYRQISLIGYAWNKLYRKDFLLEQGSRFKKGISLIEDILFNGQLFLSTDHIVILNHTYYHYMRRDTESLGSKYYPDYVELKLQALQMDLQLLEKWKLSKKQIHTYATIRKMEIRWYGIKNIHLSSLSIKEKREACRNILKNKELDVSITSFSTKKEVIKYALLKTKNPYLLLMFTK